MRYKLIFLGLISLSGCDDQTTRQSSPAPVEEPITSTNINPTANDQVTDQTIADVSASLRHHEPYSIRILVPFPA